MRSGSSRARVNTQGTTSRRTTQNSRRAGQISERSEFSRTNPSDPTVQRVESRLKASAERRSSLSPEFIPQNINTSELDSGANLQKNKMATHNRHRMPKPGEKNAPSFDTEKPEELGRFFDRVEDWFQEEEIDDDEEKKKKIVRYLDADSEVQWKAFTKFATGTFEEFKAQVMASYPAAEEVMKGSVAALKRKIKRIGPVTTDDRDELLSLIRIMTAEVMKLKRITPPIHTNRELVELFLNRLTPEFANRVAGKLSMQRLLNKTTVNAGAVPRNPEDMYDIDEVMDMAKHTSLEQANPFGKFLGFSQTNGSSSVKLEEVVAKLTDSINLQTQYNKQVEQKLTSLQSFMTQPKSQGNGSYGGNTQSAGYGGSTLLNNQGPPKCYYCGGPHKIPDCEHVHRHLDLGWIKRIDGVIKSADGLRLPRDINKTTKEIVEANNKPKPGLIHMSRIPDRQALYSKNSNLSSFMQNNAEMETETPEMQHIMKLVQRLGVDEVQKVLTSQVQAQEEAEEALDWEQNFDGVQ